MSKDRKSTWRNINITVQQREVDKVIQIAKSKNISVSKALSMAVDQFINNNKLPK